MLVYYYYGVLALNLKHYNLLSCNFWISDEIWTVILMRISKVHPNNYTQFMTYREFLAAIYIYQTLKLGVTQLGYIYIFRLTPKNPYFGGGGFVTVESKIIS